MRKFFLLFFVLVPLFSFSQELLFDKPEQDGSRFLGTYYAWFKTGFTDTHPIGYSLNRIIDESKNINEYCLGVKINSGFNFELPKAGLLLIKCSDESVIELKQISRDYLTDDPVGTYVLGTRIHVISGLYSISEEQIKKICSEGIIKVRIETHTDLIDSEYSKKKAYKIAESFKDLYEVICTAASQKKDIRSGF